MWLVFYSLKLLSFSVAHPYLCAKFQKRDGFQANQILISSGFQLIICFLF